MKKAVILFNLGGPDKLESVEPFLFNLFNDPAIISIPSIFRYPLAKLISKRRATIATAEGQKRSIELNADAQLYEAKKSAEAVKISADADAYAIKVKAEADAEQTRVVGQAIKDDGQPAINYEIMKRQVDGLSELASSDQTKTLVVPSDITKALGSLELLLGTFSKDKDK